MLEHVLTTTLAISTVVLAVSLLIVKSVLKAVFFLLATLLCVAALLAIWGQVFAALLITFVLDSSTITTIVYLQNWTSS